MSKQSQSVVHFTDLGIPEELKNKEFRDQFFRTEREIDIPAQIKTLRKFRGMTQTQLAEKVGTKQSAVCRIERAQESNWELETLVKLAEALDARLSVVIEPYEVVASRYASAQAKSPSAADADTISAQRNDAQLQDGAHQSPEQKRSDFPSIAGNEGGAKWN